MLAAQAGSGQGSRQEKETTTTKIDSFAFLPVLGHFLPIPEDSGEGVMAAWSPYPPALVPSSDIPQAAVGAKMWPVALKLLNCGRKALKISAITSSAGWVLLRALTSTARPPP